MRIELTKTEFECLWQNCPEFKERVYRKLADEDLTQTEPVDFSSLIDDVQKRFKGKNQKIAAIKFVRNFVNENRGFPVKFKNRNREEDLSSLTGAKVFVEDFCYL